MVNVSNESQPKAWLNGHYVPAEKHSDGNWYVKDESGKLIKVDPNDLFGINNWESLNESFETRKENHKKWQNHWLALQQRAGEIYDSAKASLKTGKDLLTTLFNNTGCKKVSELEGSDKKLAKSYMSQISSAGADKRRAVSDSIFYGRLATDESFQIGDISNLQNVAEKILT